MKELRQKDLLQGMGPIVYTLKIPVQTAVAMGDFEERKATLFASIFRAVDVFNQGVISKAKAVVKEIE